MTELATLTKPDIGMSLHFGKRAEALIPMGAQTASKASARFAKGFGPQFLARGKGAHVWDVDGNEYIDCPMGLGSVLLGHGDPDVAEAVYKAAKDGTSMSLATHLEVQLAEEINRWVPCAQNVRLVKNGSDATSACIRLARAFTKRDVILRCGYHGWHNWALNKDYDCMEGVPQCERDNTISVKFGDFEELEDAFLGRLGKVAAFILEPVCLSKPPLWYLPKVKDLCHKNGALLIYDEVITGIRMNGSAQTAMGVLPDLCAIGKGLANGFSLAAVCGRRDVMQKFCDTHISGTYFGETSAIAASLATLRKLGPSGFWHHQNEVGDAVKMGYIDAVAKYHTEERTRIIGLSHWSVVDWNDPAQFTLFQQEMLRRGILFSGSFFPSLSHTTEDVTRVATAFDESMAIVADAIGNDCVAQKLECAVNTSIFKRNA